MEYLNHEEVLQLQGQQEREWRRLHFRQSIEQEQDYRSERSSPNRDVIKRLLTFDHLCPPPVTNMVKPIIPAIPHFGDINENELRAMVHTHLGIIREYMS